MHHSKIEASAEIHPAWCNCRDCASRDAMAFARSRRILRAQAAAFLLFLLIIYGTIIVHAGDVAASVGLAR